MGTNLYEAEEETVGGVCTQPIFIERVSRYLDDPVNSSAAEQVEEHLLDCRGCREFVDTMLSIRAEGTRSARGNEQSCKEGRLARIATYRKERLQRQ
jgi:predicted anti-sigma-YlaC factor YlaD